jgi:hypothetical protein
MPLRDHFRPPLYNRRHWQAFHGAWPTVIVMALNRKLPRRYVAEPHVQLAGSAEIDIGTFDEEDAALSGPGSGPERGTSGGVATAVWAPAHPTLAVVTNFPAEAVYEVRVFDQQRGSRLVAVVELVSPANKDRPEHCRAFVAKCAAFLQEQVSVTIVDLVTTRHFNLYSDLLELIGQTDPSLATEPPSLYAVACRGTRQDRTWLLESWFHPLVVGQPLPMLPLWLADNLAVPLELEASYEETCRILRIS